MSTLTTLLNQSWALLGQGVIMTLSLWITTACLSLTIGLLWGILRSNKVRVAGISAVLDGVTFVLRGIPYYIQLLLAYFVIPEVTGISLSAFAAASLSLGFCSAAYVSQMVRGCINTIANGQWMAAQALGYSTIQTLWFIIIPQLMRAILPALTGELDQLLKSTSIVSAIGVLELTRAGMNIIAREMNPIPVYCFIAMMYLMLSSILNGIAHIIERRLS